MAKNPAEASKVPGMVCPQCASRIVVTMEQLLAAAPIRCGNCGLELTVDREQSRDALQSLEELRRSLQQFRGAQ
ncbi:MAG: hypothetical protein LAQ69_08500 [Acidobacteriia bacterium]|nr:hypothetical protein [Terriglobia bacterium]